MQVRSLPALVAPRLPTGAPQRVVAPVAAQDERSQPSVPIPINRNRKAKSNDLNVPAALEQRYSYVRVNAEDFKTARALQTYFEIQTLDEQERSQRLFGIDTQA